MRKDAKFYRARAMCALRDMLVSAEGVITDTRTGSVVEPTPTSLFNPYKKVLWYWSPVNVPMYGRKTQFTVHRMVALTHIHNPRPDLFLKVDHIDRDKENNHRSNLRWVSHTVNAMNSNVPCVQPYRIRIGWNKRGGPILKACPERGWQGILTAGCDKVLLTEVMKDFEECRSLTLFRKHAMCEDRYQAECAREEWDPVEAVARLFKAPAPPRCSATSRQSSRPSTGGYGGGRASCQSPRTSSALSVPGGP